MQFNRDRRLNPFLAEILLRQYTKSCHWRHQMTTSKGRTDKSVHVTAPHLAREVITEKKTADSKSQMLLTHSDALRLRFETSFMVNQQTANSETTKTETKKRFIQRLTPTFPTNSPHKNATPIKIARQYTKRHIHLIYSRTLQSPGNVSFLVVSVAKNWVCNSNILIEDISVVTLKRTDTTLDLSQ